MKEISVIVPCYNVESYLEKCLDSILKNKVDLEIILVNDGSTDHTLEIINKYKEKYPNIIKIVDKENGGLSSARNAGLKVANGQYISFVDSDDTIASNMYETMLIKAKDKDFDIVVCNESRIYEDYKIEVASNVNNDCLNKEEIKKIMPYIYPAACNKIYKREIFKVLEFKMGVAYEDIDFTYRLLPQINSIGTINQPFYNYIQRDGSITYTFNEKLYDIIYNLNDLVTYYKDNNIYEEYYEELEYTYVRYLYATFIKRLAKCRDKKQFNKGVNIVINNVKNNFPNYKNNKYLTGKKGLYLKLFNPFIANIIFKIEKNRKN